MPSDINEPCVSGIKTQSVPVSDLLILSDRGAGATLQERVSSVLNDALGKVDLASYDYILRVDSDTVLPPNFLERNLGLADVVGSGYAHLIRVPAFLDAMGGKFNVVSDDSYLNYKFMQCGYKCTDWKVKPCLMRKPGKKHRFTYFLNQGYVMWVCGYEPFHVLYEPFHVFGTFIWDRRHILVIFGYFISLLKRKPRLDVANFVFCLQIRRLMSIVRVN